MTHRHGSQGAVQQEQLGDKDDPLMPPRWYVFERRLIAIKFVYVFVFANTASLIPFFVTYYYEWGLTPTELSLIQAAVPFFGFLVRPVIGRVADRTGKHRLVFIICCLWCALFHLPHMLIPKLVTDPSFADFNFSNSSNTTDVLTSDTPLPDCDDNNAAPSRLPIIFSLLILRLVAYAGQSPTTDLADAFCYAATRRDARVWGRQRVWSTVGWASATFFVGFMLQRLGTHYWLFVITACFSVATAISVCFLDPLHPDQDSSPREKRSGSTTSVRDNPLWPLLKERHVQVYLVFCVLNGALLATEFSFLFIFLKDMGSDELLIGLHQVVDSLSEFPLFMFSGYLLKSIGFVPAFCLSFATYVIRLTAYSFLDHPLYMVLIIEIIHCFSFTIYVAAGTGYADAIAPPGLAATLQGVFQGCFFGLGIGLGNLIGGLLYSQIGPRNLFRGAAVISGLCCLAYALLYRFWLRDAIRQQEKEVDLTTLEPLTLEPDRLMIPSRRSSRNWSRRPSTATNSSRSPRLPSSRNIDTSMFSVVPSPRFSTAFRHGFADWPFIDSADGGCIDDDDTDSRGRPYECFHVGLLVGPAAYPKSQKKATSQNC